MKLGIHGSRTLNDERVKIIILEAIKKYNPTRIITHAEPDGVCAVARKTAKEVAIPLTVHFLNFKYLRGAFEHRSKDVMNDSDVDIVIHDGNSKGTSNEILLLNKMKKKYEVSVIEVSKHTKSVGFKINKQWDKLEL